MYVSKQGIQTNSWSPSRTFLCMSKTIRLPNWPLWSHSTSLEKIQLVNKVSASAAGSLRWPATPFRWHQEQPATFLQHLQCLCPVVSVLPGICSGEELGELVPHANQDTDKPSESHTRSRNDEPVELRTAPKVGLGGTCRELDWEVEGLWPAPCSQPNLTQELPVTVHRRLHLYINSLSTKLLWEQNGILSWKNYIKTIKGGRVRTQHPIGHCSSMKHLACVWTECKEINKYQVWGSTNTKQHLTTKHYIPSTLPFKKAFNRQLMIKVGHEWTVDDNSNNNTDNNNILSTPCIPGTPGSTSYAWIHLNFQQLKRCTDDYFTRWAPPWLHFINPKKEQRFPPNVSSTLGGPLGDCTREGMKE